MLMYGGNQQNIVIILQLKRNKFNKKDLHVPLAFMHLLGIWQS